MCKCSVVGCEKKYHSKGYCKIHYGRVKRNGIPTSLWDIKIRFHKKYIPEPMSGCWLWEGSANEDGYGYISKKNIIVYAHRVSWELHRGPIPEGLCVLHTCDTPACVNPDHLWLGTHTDNVRDSVKKGRMNHSDMAKKSNKNLVPAIEAWLKEREG